jgi:hypothetical protein
LGGGLFERPGLPFVTKSCSSTEPSLSS